MLWFTCFCPFFMIVPSYWSEPDGRFFLLLFSFSFFYSFFSSSRKLLIPILPFFNFTGVTVLLNFTSSSSSSSEFLLQVIVCYSYKNWSFSFCFSLLSMVFLVICFFEVGFVWKLVLEV